MLMTGYIGIFEIFDLIFLVVGALALYFIVKLAIKNAIKDLKKDGTLK